MEEPQRTKYPPEKTRDGVGQPLGSFRYRNENSSCTNLYLRFQTMYYKLSPPIFFCNLWP